MRVRARVSVSALVGLVASVAFAGHAAAQVNLPPGFEIVEFGFSPYLTDVPRINNCGQIVFGKKPDDISPGWALYLYDNGAIREIAREKQGHIPAPDINDHGTIVYMTGILGEYDSERLVLWEKRRTTNLGRGSAPSINNNGVVAAMVFQPMGCREWFNIFLYHGGERTRLTGDSFLEQMVRLNDREEVTWARFDVCGDQWVSEIPLYSNGEITLLPSEASQRQLPDINNRGQVVWSSPLGVESWQDGETTLVTDSGTGPSINDHGDIVFIRWHPETERLD